MSSNFLGRTAIGVAAATATLLIATPGLASADVVDVSKDGNGTVTLDGKSFEHGKGLTIICIHKEEQQKKKAHKMRGWNGKQDAKNLDEGQALEENGLGDAAKRSYGKSKKDGKKTSNEATVTQTAISVNINCGDNVGQSASSANSAAVAQDNAANASAAGNLGLGGPLRLGAPRGAVDGGFGGESTPNAGLALGGAGALAAAALGTVLMRRRTADEPTA